MHCVTACCFANFVFQFGPLTKTFSRIRVRILIKDFAAACLSWGPACTPTPRVLCVNQLFILGCRLWTSKSGGYVMCSFTAGLWPQVTLKWSVWRKASELQITWNDRTEGRKRRRRAWFDMKKTSAAIAALSRKSAATPRKHHLISHSTPTVSSTFRCSALAPQNHRKLWTWLLSCVHTQQTH